MTNVTCGQTLIIEYGTSLYLVFELVTNGCSMQAVDVSCQDVNESGRDEFVSVGCVHFEQVLTERQVRTGELDCIRRQVCHTSV